mgnify:CR=1 FL=1
MIHRQRSSNHRGSAAFELITVTAVASLVATALLPLLGSSAKVERFRFSVLKDRQDSYLFQMEAEGLGIKLEGPSGS